MTEAEVNCALGARVKQVRLLRGMTQQQVAKGYRSKSWAAQSNYESGNRAVSVYRLLQLSLILDIAPSAWLLSDDGWDNLLSKVFPAQKESEPTP
jgi:transcriptional regulator with XRE-family HTH domain